MDVFARLSDEHKTLLPLILDLQDAAEASDTATLLEILIDERDQLSSSLDAHIALEEDVAFAQLETDVGAGVIAPFRAEHVEIRALRDRALASADAGNVQVGLCLRLCDLLQAHMQREDTMLFPG